MKQWTIGETEMEMRIEIEKGDQERERERERERAANTLRSSKKENRGQF